MDAKYISGIRLQGLHADDAWVFKTTFEVYFKKEKHGILLKALFAFDEALEYVSAPFILAGVFSELPSVGRITHQSTKGICWRLNSWMFPRCNASHILRPTLGTPPVRIKGKLPSSSQQRFQNSFNQRVLPLRTHQPRNQSIISNLVHPNNRFNSHCGLNSYTGFCGILFSWKVFSLNVDFVAICRKRQNYWHWNFGLPCIGNEWVLLELTHRLTHPRRWKIIPNNASLVISSPQILQQ